MAEPSVIASAIMTRQNVTYETERLIAEALYHRRPVYIGFPADTANQSVLSTTRPIAPPTSDPVNLEAATEAIVGALEEAHSACILPGLLIARTGIRDLVQSLVDAVGLPFATMFADKPVLDEKQRFFIGMYDGKLMEESVRLRRIM